MNIPEGVTKLDASVLSSVEADIRRRNGLSYVLYKSLTLPASLTEVDAGAFVKWTSLESITLATGNRKFKVVNNHLIDTTTDTLVLGCKNKDIPVVKHIGRSAFSGRNLNSFSFVLPSGVTTIGDGAFHCGSDIRIDSVSIPVTVTSIGHLFINRYRIIYYKGTKAQWRAIKKGRGLREGVDYYNVRCADGDLVNYYHL